MCVHTAYLQEYLHQFVLAMINYEILERIVNNKRSKTMKCVEDVTVQQVEC